MLSIYYKIWVDAIAAEQTKKGREAGWKVFALVAMSALQGLNLLAVLYVFRWLSHRRMPILLPVYLFNGVMFNIAAGILLTFFVPFVILNYLLIFYNDRYLILQKNYPTGKQKLYRNYALISIGIIIVPMIFKVLFL